MTDLVILYRDSYNNNVLTMSLHTNQVGVLVHNDTTFSYQDTKQVNRDKQLIELVTDGLYDVQTLRVTVNKTLLDAASKPEFTISWGDRTSVPMQIIDLETNPGKLKSYIGAIQGTVKQIVGAPKYQHDFPSFAD